MMQSVSKAATMISAIIEAARAVSYVIETFVRIVFDSKKTLIPL